VEDGSLVPELLQQCRPDILLLDLNMPGMNGLATLQKLQAQASRTRVILLTASDSQQDFVQALKLGSGGIVQKQAATDLLIASIRRVHAGELCMDSNVTAAVIRGFVEKEATAPRQMPPPAQNQRSSFSLSPRETEIVHLVTQGFKNIDMAQKMSISEQTVKNHLHNIFDKLEVTDRLELALCVIAGNFHVGLPPQPNSTW
jgi:DNA-binding NarL/FixJ family response regulator